MLFVNLKQLQFENSVSSAASRFLSSLGLHLPCYASAEPVNAIMFTNLKTGVQKFSKYSSSYKR